MLCNANPDGSSVMGDLIGLVESEMRMAEREKEEEQAKMLPGVLDDMTRTAERQMEESKVQPFVHNPREGFSTFGDLVGVKEEPEEEKPEVDDSRGSSRHASQRPRKGGARMYFW